MTGPPSHESRHLKPQAWLQQHSSSSVAGLLCVMSCRLTLVASSRCARPDGTIKSVTVLGTMELQWSPEEANASTASEQQDILHVRSIASDTACAVCKGM